jgi:hypothetical protein
MHSPKVIDRGHSEIHPGWASGFFGERQIHRRVKRVKAGAFHTYQPRGCQNYGQLKGRQSGAKLGKQPARVRRAIA